MRTHIALKVRFYPEFSISVSVFRRACDWLQRQASAPAATHLEWTRVFVVDLPVTRRGRGQGMRADVTAGFSISPAIHLHRWCVPTFFYVCSGSNHFTREAFFCWGVIKSQAQSRPEEQSSTNAQTRIYVQLSVMNRENGFNKNIPDSKAQLTCVKKLAWTDHRTKIMLLGVSIKKRKLSAHLSRLAPN